MAILKSEDEEYVSSFTLTPQSKMITPTEKKLAYQSVQYFNWQINYGNRLIESNSSFSQSTSSPIKDGYIFFREPVDEVKQLIDSLLLLLEKKKDNVMFEPSEPSIDLSITRVGANGIKVQIFIDEGNVESGISRWDALGIRFFTSEEKLALFINDLKDDFNC